MCGRAHTLERAGRARQSPVKRHRGEPGHTRDTRDTRAHAGTRITRTNLTTIHSNPTTHPHENRDRLNSRKNNRKPGVDRSLPVQHSTVPVPGCSVPVKRHWGEPGHTRETRDTRVQRHWGSRDTQETDTDVREHHKPTSKTGTVATSTFCIHVVPRAPFPIGGDPYPGLSVSPLIWFHDGYRP